MVFLMKSIKDGKEKYKDLLDEEERKWTNFIRWDMFLDVKRIKQRLDINESNSVNANTNTNNDKKNRMIELYEKGTSDIKKKKNRTSEEMEVEKQIKECTFHPNIKIEEKIPQTKFKNDIYREKEDKNLDQNKTEND